MSRLHLPSVVNSKTNPRAHGFRTIGQALGFPNAEVAGRILRARLKR